MTETEILSELAGIFRAMSENPSLVVAPAMRPRDIRGWDSNKTVTLLLAVEERFAVTLTSREIDGLRSVGDWVRVLLARQ